ncbi:hypothetical protein AB1Y20_022220 [Prymnesium parvum]|uniref:Zn(2)-C6 fungal-type domain-containing protein n=1 Tax=Prymnesium parvum TaxID=97485 RepID=A0AB34JHB2_PRYPA
MGRELVCVACRESKVKCEYEDGWTQCVRCVRKRICCEPAAPSQRGKRSSQARLCPSNRARLLEQPAQCFPQKLQEREPEVRMVQMCLPTAPAYASFGAVGKLLPSPTERVVNSFDAYDALTYTEQTDLWYRLNEGNKNTLGAARHLAVLLLGRGLCNDRLDMICRAHCFCDYFRLSREEILREVVKALAAPLPNTLRQFPAQFAELIASSSGYAMVRAVSANVVTHEVNNAFAAAISSKEHLDKSVSAADVDTCKYLCLKQDFVHLDDVWDLCEMSAPMMSMHPTEVVSLHVPRSVRVLDRRLASYVPCAVRCIQLWDDEHHTLFQGLDLTPHGRPEPLAVLAPPSCRATAPPPHLAPRDAPRAPAEGVPLREWPCEAIARPVEKDHVESLADLLDDDHLRELGEFVYAR